MNTSGVKLLTTAEICSILDVRRETIWKFCNHGIIERYKDPISKRVFYRIPLYTLNAKLLTIKEVCFELNIERTTLRNLKNKRILVPIFETGHCVRYSRQQIEKYKEDCQKRLVRA